jgi:hypothetical protein
MAESVGVEHVEWNCIFETRCGFTEDKPRLRINEARNQPRRGDAVYPRLRACQPGAAPILRLLARRCPLRGAAVGHIGARQQLLNSAPERALEEINHCDLLEALANAGQLRTLLCP